MPLVGTMEHGIGWKNNESSKNLSSKEINLESQFLKLIKAEQLCLKYSL